MLQSTLWSGMIQEKHSRKDLNRINNFLTGKKELVEIFTFHKIDIHGQLTSHATEWVVEKCPASRQTKMKMYKKIIH